MKEKIKNIYELILGLLFIVSVILGYYKDISHMSEYCFISGMLVGIIFLTSFYMGRFKNKSLPTWLYFDCMVNIIIIFIATIAIGLSLEGAFWFIHIINPLLLFVYWCIFCDHSQFDKSMLVMTDTVFPICYFTFAAILWVTVGICPFPASLLLIDRSVIQVVLGVGAVLLIFIVLGYVLHFINKWVHGNTFD